LAALDEGGCLLVGGTLDAAIHESNTFHLALFFLGLLSDRFVQRFGEIVPLMGVPGPGDQAGNRQQRRPACQAQ